MFFWRGRTCLSAASLLFSQHLTTSWVPYYPFLTCGLHTFVTSFGEKKFSKKTGQLQATRRVRTPAERTAAAMHPKLQFHIMAMSVEEGFATPGSFQFSGASIVTSNESVFTTGPWPPDLTNQRLIQVEQGMYFHFQWSVAGVLVPILAPGMKWKIQVFFEKWGQSESPVNPSLNVNYVPVSGHLYNATIAIPPNTLSEGVYDVVAVLRLYDAVGNPLPVAGYEEKGKFQLFESA
jgi:hypothetical protein